MSNLPVPDLSDPNSPANPNVPEPELRPGWTTTEFWTTVGAGALNLLAMMALILHLKPEEQQSLNVAVTSLFTAMGMIAANAFMVWKFIHSRQVVKAEGVKANAHLKETAIHAQAQALGVSAAARAPGNGPGVY
jgi:hypothetical protein